MSKFFLEFDYLQELEQNQRRSQQNEEELLRKQNLEKKQMPKLWKNDSRIRLTEFRKGLRNQPPTNRPRDKEEERDRLKQVRYLFLSETWALAECCVFVLIV